MAILQGVEQNMNRSESSDCDCLPSCTSISYDTEINQIRMDDDAMDSYNRDRQTDTNFRFQHSLFIWIPTVLIYFFNLALQKYL
jgi:Amiloride-sensitive sodium channel